MRHAISMIGLGVLVASLVGCSAPDGPTTLDVPAGEYAATFDAARRVLRDAHFDLERVDASEGVITTAAKHSAGIMTPWDGEQSTAGQEIDDLVHNHRRVVRVTFVPEGAGEGSAPEHRGDAPVDLVVTEPAAKMSVRVIVFRDYSPGWQVQTSSVRLSTHTYDPELGRRGMLPDYETAADEDRQLAARLVKRIAERTSEKAAAQVNAE